jgi:hypothetical protein
MEGPGRIVRPNRPHRGAWSSTAGIRGGRRRNSLPDCGSAAFSLSRRNCRRSRCQFRQNQRSLVRLRDRSPRRHPRLRRSP